MAETLYELSDHYINLEQMFDDPEIPREAIEEALEEIGGKFEDKAKRCALMALNWKASESMLDVEIKRLQARKKTYANKQLWIKRYLATHMQITGTKKVEDPVTPIGLRAGRLSTVVDNDESLPVELVDTRTEFVPNKKLILEVLKAVEEYNAIESNEEFSEAAKDARCKSLLDGKPEWMHPHITSGVLKGAHLERGEDYVVIG